MLQHGAFNLLIDSCYDREQFPTIEEAIDWTWASTPEEEDAVRFVLKKFFVLNDGVYVQNRIQEELNIYHEKAETNKRIAWEREEKKRSIKEGRDSITYEAFKESQRSVNGSCKKSNEVQPNHKPVTSNQEPIKELDQSEIDHCFDEFWESGIKKVNKKKTKPLFAKHLKNNNKPTGPTIYDLTSALVKDVKSRLESNQLGFAEMHPTTYFNGERWNDEISKQSSSSAQQSNFQQPERTPLPEFQL